MKKILLFLLCALLSNSFYAQTCGSLSFGTATTTGTTTTIPVILTGNSTDAFFTFDVDVNYTNGSNIVFDETAMDNSVNPSLSTAFSMEYDNGKIEMRAQGSSLPAISPITLFEIVIDVNPDECTNLSFPSGTAGINNITWADFTNCSMPLGGNSNDNCGPAVEVSGYIDYIANAFELEDVDVSIADKLDLTTTLEIDISDSNGDFAFAPLSPGVDYRVTPSKTDEEGCGVTSYDSYLVNEHIQNRTDLPDKKAKMAADVNLSNTISTFDIVQMNQQINGSSSLPNAWYFITDSGYASMTYDGSDNVPNYSADTYEDYDNLLTDVTNSDFYAIKTGDPSESCNPTASLREGEIFAQSRNRSKLIFSDVNAKFNEEIEIPVYIPTFTNKVMLSLGFEVDANLLEDVTLKAGKLPEWSSDSYHIFEKDGKTFINIIWFSTSSEGVNLLPTEPLFYIKAKAKKAIRGLDKVIQFSNIRGDDNRVYAPYGDIRPLNLEILPLVSKKVISSPFEGNSHKAYPTIVQSQSTFNFELKRAETVELMIINLNGQILKQRSFDLNKGKQQITLDDLGNLESGTFHYHIIANGQKLSGTLFKTK